MISKNCSFKDFLEAVKGRGGDEILYLTNQEATQAERLCFRGYRANTQNPSCCGRYSEKLKGFMIYLRHGVKMSCLKDSDLKGFGRVC